jgi:response regulator of citrate/malate metabolism
VSTDKALPGKRPGGLSNGIFKEILEQLDESDGMLTTEQLARKVGIEESALEGMLKYLARKGYLDYCSIEEACGGSCEGSCSRFCKLTGCCYK